MERDGWCTADHCISYPAVLRWMSVPIGMPPVVMMVLGSVAVVVSL